MLWTGHSPGYEKSLLSKGVLAPRFQGIENFPVFDSLFSSLFLALVESANSHEISILQFTSLVCGDNVERTRRRFPLLSIQDSRHGLDEDGHAEATNTGPFRFGLLILSEQSSVDANRFPRVDNPIGRRCERNGH